MTRSNHMNQTRMKLLLYKIMLNTTNFLKIEWKKYIFVKKQLLCRLPEKEKYFKCEKEENFMRVGYPTCFFHPFLPVVSVFRFLFSFFSKQNSNVIDKEGSLGISIICCSCLLHVCIFARINSDHPVLLFIYLFCFVFLNYTFISYII